MGKTETVLIAVLDGNEYSIELENNTLAGKIASLCPLKLDMRRSCAHEYYGTLPEITDPGEAKQTSAVRAGGVYYFDAWNAFSLVFQDADIRPYSVHKVGQAEPALADALACAGDAVTVHLLSRP